MPEKFINIVFVFILLFNKIEKNLKFFFKNQINIIICQDHLFILKIFILVKKILIA